ncbi:hypothetical protein Pmani_022820, partial [Petrolisthes manimaculis]
KEVPKETRPWEGRKDFSRLERVSCRWDTFGKLSR